MNSKRDMTMRPASSFIRHPSALRNRGFTLIEMLIVVGIITLVVLIAIPSFRAMTGGRSIDAASNNISAALGRARANAIGLQRTTGVLFYYDRALDRVGAMIVREVYPAGTGPAASASGTPIYLDVEENMEFILLPPGTAVQTLDDLAGGADRYIGYNPVAGDATTAAGGAILFDGTGKLLVRPYRLIVKDGSSASQLFKTLASNPSVAVPTSDSNGSASTYGATANPNSSIGLAIFDLINFRDAYLTGATVNSSMGDPEAGQANTGETAEETWLNQNAMPFLVNRYNGTLIRAE